jgi:hypothetical protein
MKNKTIRLGALRLRQQEGPKPISTDDHERLTALFEKVSRSQERSMTGEALREYIGEIEKMARGIFAAEQVTPDPVVQRCAQIVREYEDPKLDSLSEEALRRYMREVGDSTPGLLRKGAISESLYGAARVLLRINVLKLTMAGPSPNPWLLAEECMSVEAAFQQLIATGAFDREGQARTPREEKELVARERQDKMRQWIDANGTFPTNDKATRALLGYKNPQTEAARRLFSRDLTAVHATHKVRE